MINVRSKTVGRLHTDTTGISLDYPAYVPIIITPHMKDATETWTRNTNTTSRTGTINTAVTKNVNFLNA